MLASVKFLFRGIDFLANNRVLEIQNAYIPCIELPEVLFIHRFREGTATMLDMPIGRWACPIIPNDTKGVKKDFIFF